MHKVKKSLKVKVNVYVFFKYTFICTVNMSYRSGTP